MRNAITLRSSLRNVSLTDYPVYLVLSDLKFYRILPYFEYCNWSLLFNSEASLELFKRLGTVHFYGGGERSSGEERGGRWYYCVRMSCENGVASVGEKFLWDRWR